jgi:hypothetical protein
MAKIKADCDMQPLGMVQNLLELPELNRLLRSGHGGRQGSEQK